MFFRKSNNCVLWMQNSFFLIIFVSVGSSNSHFSGRSSQELSQPLDVFFYDVPQTKNTLTLPLQAEARNMSCPTTLNVDETCILVTSNVDRVIKFQYQSLECDNCTLIDYKSLQPHESQHIVLKLASLGTVYQVSYEDNETVCNSKEEYLGENSVYHLNVNETNCSLVTVKEPDFVYTPILIAVGAYFTLALLCMIWIYIKRTQFFNRLFHQDSLDDLAAAYSSSTTIEDKKSKAASQRLRSLDTVRGISIVVMIFVNYGGGNYQFFDHSIWNGLTVADLVFPWFIWMMGMSMALSLRSQLRKIVSKKKIFFKIVKRSLILFGLGVMLNTTCTVTNLHNLRILGVLQRFGVCYFVVATVHLFYACADDKINSGSPLRDIVHYGGEWLIMLTFLVLHLLLSFFVHAPDCPRGYFGPGGLHDRGAYAHCTGGAAGYIDRILLGSSHLYQKPSIHTIYKTTLPYDPEGLLGYLTSIFLVFLGLQAGKILLIYKDSTDRITRWLTWGLITGGIAATLCLLSKDDGWIPVNKNLWSVSFIMATSSLAFILLSICYYLCDIKKCWSGAPFYYAGMNSIVLYVGHGLTHNMFPFRWEMPSTHMNLLFMNLWGTTLWVIVALWMYHKNVFISV